MARTLDGTSARITLGIGGLNAAFGALSMAAICRITDTTVSRRLIAIGTATTGTARYGFGFTSTGATIDFRRGNNAGSPPTITMAAADGWVLVAVTVAAGSATPRYHKYVFSTNTWTHENGTGTLADGTAAATSAYIGATNGGAASFWQGDIEIEGVWNANLTDEQVEALAFSLQAWFAPAQPRGLWLLDQGATTQKVLDLAGLGANESAITGTTVSTQSVPLFNRFDDAIVVTRQAPAGGGAFPATAGDTVTVSDSAARATMAPTRTAADTVTCSDQSARASARARTAGDTVAVSDVAAGQRGVSSSATDSWTGTDTAARAAVSRARAAADTVSRGDTAARTLTTGRAAADTVAVTDTVSRSAATRARTATETITVSDSAAVTGSVSSFSRTAVDTVSRGDTATRVSARTRTASESLTVTDQATRATLGRVRTGADSFTVGDQGARSGIRSRAANDTVGVVADQALRGAVAAGRQAGDGVSITDVVARVFGAAVTAADLVFVSDDAFRPAGGIYSTRPGGYIATGDGGRIRVPAGTLGYAQAGVAGHLEGAEAGRIAAPATAGHID